MPEACNCVQLLFTAVGIGWAIGLVLMFIPTLPE